MNAARALSLLVKVADIPGKPPSVATDVYNGLIKYTKAVEVGLPLATTFDFGELRAEDAHKDFGLDLVAKELFRLPYPIVYFSCGQGVLQGSRGHFLAYSLPERTDFWFEIVEMVELQGRLAVSHSIKVFGAKGDDVRASCWCLQDDEWGAEKTKTASASSLGNVAGLVALLMSKDVQATLEPVSAELAARRKRKGKYPLRDTYVVRLRPSAIARNGVVGGTHASPIMHWRRGHYRRLDKGTPEERLIPIPPCLVNAGDTDFTPDPKDYVMASRPGLNIKRQN